MNAIQALAFRHLALNPRLDNRKIPNKEEAVLQYYYETLRYVQRAMQYSGYKTSLELLATALIISAYEMLDNSTNDWERHLEGVFLIQRSQTIHGESGGLHSAAWWAWLCQDICADATTEENIQRRIDGAVCLRKMLDDWQRHRTVEFSPLPLGSSEYSTCFRPIWIRPPALGMDETPAPHYDPWKID